MRQVRLSTSGFTPLEISTVGSSPSIRRRVLQHKVFLTGFTLIEIMVVVVIIGMLAAILVTNIAGRSDEAAAELTKSLIRGTIANKIEFFKLDNKRYPNKLDELVYRPPDVAKWPQGGYLTADQIKDAWGKDLMYRMPSQFSDEPYDIISYGLDAKDGGEGVNEDIWNHDKWKRR